MTNIVPGDYRTHAAVELIRTISSIPEDTYYTFIGNHMPVNGTPSINDDTKDLLISSFRNMIAAKVVKSSDASMMVRNIPWAANTAFARYDDSDINLNTENYFAIVNGGAFSHIWKCLDNNNGGLSTSAPDIAQIDVNDISYRTADNYLWKYMASSSLANVAKFGTNLFFPIVANSTVTAAAVTGAIDVISVDTPGLGYQNYLSGTWAAGDIRINGNTITYAVTGNTNSSAVNGYYTGCNLYIAGGTGVGQYKTILDYVSNANGNFIQIDTPFTVPPQNGSQYQIYPGVLIVGSGGQTINAAARAIINTVGNTVYRIDMLNRGAGYSYLAAGVIANAVAQPISAAIIRPIYAPFNGHGFDAYGELGATRVALSVSMNTTEGNTIPATNQYQQIGILKDPVFANVIVNFSSVLGTVGFLGSEQVYTYSSRLLQNNVTLVASSNTVTVANGVLTSQLTSGDPVFFSTNTTFWYSTVSSVTNTTSMIITSAPLWGSTTAQMSFPTLGSGQGLVTSLPGANTVGLSNVTGQFLTGQLVIGVASGTRGVVNNVTRNAVTKSFDTFVPMYKYVATAVSGSFQQNEIMFMGANLALATSTAAIHSVVANSGTLTILASNNVGAFAEDLSQQIKGANSGAVATLTTKYGSEIKFGSSKVLYLENITPVTRSNTTADTINIILEF